MHKYVLVFFIIISASYSASAQFPEWQFWLSADTGISATKLDEDVTYWNDLSENLYVANDSNMGAPKFKPNEINFHPAVYFDGIDDGLNLGSDYLYSGEEGAVIFCVVKPDNVFSQKDRQFIFDFGHYPDEGYGVTYGADKAGIYCPTSHGGVDISQGVSHSRDDEVTIFMGSFDFENDVEVCFNGKNMTSEAIELAAMGESQISENPEPDTSSKGPVTIGRQSMESGLSSDSGRLFNGSIAEIIVYNSLLSSTEMSVIHSYLAIKYGISLDQSSSQDYLASSGKIVWEKSENDTFIHGIAGIGKDSDTSLDQGISASVNDDKIMTLANGSFMLPNYPIVPEDMKYYTWSHNNIALDSLNNNDVPSGIDGRIGRIWRISCKDASTDSTINWDHVSIGIDLNKLTGSAAMPSGLTDEDLLNLRLLVNDTKNMKVATTFIPDSVNAASKEIFFYLNEEISNGDYFTVSRLPGSPLPVELMSFTGEALEKSVKLKWQTASEIDNDKFVVQTSSDLESWETIAQIKGAGNSNTVNYYSLDDKSPIDGESYYRLKQVDFNGKFTYSKSVRVQFTEQSSSVLEVLIYPNPVVNQAHIVSSASVNDTYIELLDKKGQVRYSAVIPRKEKFKLNAIDMENGVYILRANSGQSSSYQKIIVQNN